MRTPTTVMNMRGSSPLMVMTSTWVAPDDSPARTWSFERSQSTVKPSPEKAKDELEQSIASMSSDCAAGTAMITAATIADAMPANLMVMVSPQNCEPRSAVPRYNCDGPTAPAKRDLFRLRLCTARRALHG